VGQPFASFFSPFGHCGLQAMAGQTVPLPPPLLPVGGGDGMLGGTQPPEGSVQLHWHGGHGAPGAQLGHAQPQPIGGGGVTVWHTPSTHGCPAGHTAPMPNHAHWVSWAQVGWSVWTPHGSGALGAGPPFGSGEPVPLEPVPLEPVPLEPEEPPLFGCELPELLGVPLDVPLGAGTAPPEPQPHAQGAHVVPGAHGGHAQVQVPSSTQPPPLPPEPHVQSQGAHGVPGAQAGQAQVQVPPPPLVPMPPPVQSHSGGLQVVPAAQATGVTQLHEPPFASRG
jgi:hypothetical protein